MDTLKSLLLFIIVPAYTTEMNHDYNGKDSSQVELRAVFIKCEIEENLTPYGSETSRFQREELFKHNVLRDCKKKLGLTVKMISDPNQSLSEEYIPIEHVFDGSNKKRVRLLNPYILRLRRKPLFEAYKLHELDTIRGIITRSNHNLIEDEKKNRLRRNTQFPYNDRLNSDFAEEDNANMCFPNNASNWQHVFTCFLRFRFDLDGGIPNRLHNDDYSSKFNDPVAKLSANPLKITLSTVHNKHIYQDGQNKETYRKILSEEDEADIFDRPVIIEENPNIKSNVVKEENPFMQSNVNKDVSFNYFKEKSSYDGTSSPKLDDNNNVSTLTQQEDIFNLSSTENTFVLYEIAAPDLWFGANVQLYEKLSTPAGKTVWRDINKEEPARVNTTRPDWTNQDIHIRYRSAEWMSREDFVLPSNSICLLVPQIRDLRKDLKEDKFKKFIIVPCEDIEPIDQDNYNFYKRDDNYSDMGTSSSASRKHLRRVLIRVSRALFSESKDKYMILDQGPSKYLRIPSRQQHHAQIDLEARADENQLVYVGSSGRLTTVVSDTTRRTRSILTIQATNTGLAAARFRVKTRDCGPNIIRGRINEKEKDIDPILIPPRHTRSYRIDLPVDIPVEVVRCSVALVNDDEESVAVREVRIKLGDRCFCVWHCDCVCLDEDPKLQCQEMSENQQVAAGIALSERPRHVRAACYPDNVTINLLVVIIGVIFLLLILGVLKAIMGIFCRCVGLLGIEQLIQTPRRLDRYYESSLRSRPVVYDEDGWPVHPDTHKRTVRLISKPMEFMLNIIYFIIIPCLIIRNALKKIIMKICRKKEKDSLNTINSKTNNTKKCFSSHDMQTTEARWRWRRRGRRLNQWMTPQAEELSTEIWRNGLAPLCLQAECMRPLIPDAQCREKPYERQSPIMDSEQEDTEFVITQMQRSRESIAKSKHKIEPK